MLIVKDLDIFCSISDLISKFYRKGKEIFDY